MTKIHNLARLFEIVKPHIKLTVDDALVDTLDRLYIDARYPGDLGLLPAGKPSRNDAKRFYNFANTVHKTVCQLLEKDV